MASGQEFNDDEVSNPSLNSPTRSMDSEDLQTLQETLQNIQSLISITRKNIEALNSKFADFQPPMYVSEYNELTSKLHGFIAREEELERKIRLEMENNSQGDASDNIHPIMVTQDDEISYPAVVPCSPFKSVIRAHLPNQQRTSVQVRPGLSVREALAKAMSLRKLSPDMCIVYKGETKIPIAWDVDISMLEGEEITVEINSNFPITTSISHNYARKTFFSLTYCECCRKLLFQGFYCRTCGYKFHQRCAAKVPTLCQQIGEQTKYLQYLLAQGPDSIAGILNPGDSRYFNPPSPDPLLGRTGHPTLAQQHSTSVPNVYFNLVEQAGQNRGDGAHYSPGDGGASVSLIPSMGEPKATHSTQVSPTKVMRSRPRARSADESSKKLTDIIRTARESIDDWEISNDELLKGQRIGSGSFGTVYKGHWHGPVAIKTLNVKNPTPAQLQAFKNEVAVLKKTRHVNILLFMGCVSDPELCIVTQWCEGSSLYKHLHVMEIKFELLHLIKIAHQIAQGMDYLHAKNIIHRDLKSNNIFLRDDLTVKIGDFGLATVKANWAGSQQFHQPAGSILWMAPEVIRMQEESPYSFQSDVYAFGIVLYELLAGLLPYGNIKNKDQILFMVGQGKLKPDFNKARPDTPKGMRRLAKNCVKFQRDQRPLFKQILASLDSILYALPKIQHSVSEPTLNSAQLQSDELMYECASPKTPVNFPPYGAFPF
ncbi:raf homolog serine/threonine-protein kinase Raf [Neocloeon triangulifer]|uniref:raf homolog serine/threonine-protein kinase Raf n=1 Tax=Neocloeon triangulifer TaxID=2078957 RepID=UPI00286F6570|nr:raf homolog serine/threonine-protein kinase Raf [Neocloeon triangulifer]